MKTSESPVPQQCDIQKHLRFHIHANTRLSSVISTNGEDSEALVIETLW